MDLDEFLERELKGHAATGHAPTPLPSGAKYHAASLSGGFHLPVISNLLSALTAKGAVGLAVATVATGGVVAGVVTTGSPNPGVWGQQVVQAVQGCKAQYLPGASPSSSPSANPSTSPGVSPSPTPKNVGQCVRAFASQKGQTERALHEKGKGTPQGKPSGLPSGRPNGLPSSHPTGRPSGLPTPHQTGRPSGLPSGPPSGVPSGN